MGTPPSISGTAWGHLLPSRRHTGTAPAVVTDIGWCLGLLILMVFPTPLTLLCQERGVGSPTDGGYWPCCKETCSFSTHSCFLFLCYDGSCMIAAQGPLGVPEVGRADVCRAFNCCCLLIWWARGRDTIPCLILAFSFLFFSCFLSTSMRSEVMLVPTLPKAGSFLCL